MPPSFAVSVKNFIIKLNMERGYANAHISYRLLDITATIDASDVNLELIIYQKIVSTPVV